MQATTEQEANNIPYWDKLKDLSKEDKLTLITMLQDSVVEYPKPEPFEEAVKRAISIEEFRALCHQKVKELYGSR